MDYGPYGKLVDMDNATDLLDEIRLAIQNYEMVIRDQGRPDKNGKMTRKMRTRGSWHKASKKVSVTISIGVAGNQTKQEKPEDVLKNADQALYKAKQAGRNQVIQFQETNRAVT